MSLIIKQNSELLVFFNFNDFNDCDKNVKWQGDELSKEGEDLGKRWQTLVAQIL